MKLVNLDWLEVFLYEPAIPEPRDAAYYLRQGFQVDTRDYGTPHYREVFVLYDSEHFPMFEIRRNPYSLKSEGGIFDARACHLRFSNRFCYQARCIDQLRDFILQFGYEFRGITRVDICADFNRFDDKTDPQKFLNRFMAGRFLKIHQSKLAAHGVEFLTPLPIDKGAHLSAYASETIGGRVFNSIKWGAPTSAISTKMYNKSLEVAQGKPKKYIQARWKRAGLTNETDCPVWRVEFSLKSSAKNFVKLDTGELFYLSLTTIDTAEKLEGLFHALAQIYFHFKAVTYTRNGTFQRKDRCADYFPFRYNRRDAMKLVRLPLTRDPNRTDKMIMRRLADYWNDQFADLTTTEKRGLIDFMSFLSERFDEDELRQFEERGEDFMLLLRPYHLD